MQMLKPFPPISRAIVHSDVDQSLTSDGHQAVDFVLAKVAILVGKMTVTGRQFLAPHEGVWVRCNALPSVDFISTPHSHPPFSRHCDA